MGAGVKYWAQMDDRRWAFKIPGVTKANGMPGGRVRQDGPTSFECRVWVEGRATIVLRRRSLSAARFAIVDTLRKERRS